MKNKCYQQSKMKKNKMNKRLIQMRDQGREFVFWKLDLTQKQDIEELGYRVEPFIYLIKTKIFEYPHNVHSAFLKDIHYAKKRKQHYLAKPLKQREIYLLEE